MKNKHDSADNDYVDGMLRLIAISRRNGRTPCSNDRNQGSLKSESRRICLVCGYMWDTYGADQEKGPKKCPACSSIRWNDADLKHHRCKLCSHRWMSKLESPLMCPKCKSKRWDTDVTAYTCGSCGTMTKLSGPPGKCPKCGSDNLYSDVVDCICKKCGFVGKTDIRRQSVCPVCSTKLSIVSCSDDGRSTQKKGNSYSKMTPDVLNTLRSDTDDLVKMVELTNRNGLDSTDSEILIRYHNGEGAVDIARATDVSLNKVITIMTFLQSLDEV